MQANIPSLPSLRNLPSYAVIDGLIGLLYGSVRKTRPSLTMAIFAIRSIANVLFYHMTNYLVGGKDLLSQKIFLISSTMINLIFIIVLRELNLIGHIFSGLIGVAVLGQLIYRVTYIQKKERELIKAQIV